MASRLPKCDDVFADRPRLTHGLHLHPLRGHAFEAFGAIDDLDKKRAQFGPLSAVYPNLQKTLQSIGAPIAIAAYSLIASLNVKLASGRSDASR